MSDIKFKTSKMGNRYFVQFPYVVFIHPKHLRKGKIVYVYQCKHMFTDNTFKDDFIYSTPLKAGQVAIERIKYINAVTNAKYKTDEQTPSTDKNTP